MSLIMGNPPLDTALLPEYQEWKATDKGLGLWNYLNMRADYDLAAAFSKLFWPDFVEVDGCILLAEHFNPDGFSRWKDHYKGDTTAIEAMINHTHIIDLFLNGPGDTSYTLALYDYLGSILLTCWKHALQEIFPTRQFAFEYAAEDKAAPEITFYQIK